MSPRQRIKNLFIAIDQLAWVVLTLGRGSPDETISAAAWRMEQHGQQRGYNRTNNKGCRTKFPSRRVPDAAEEKFQWTDCGKGQQALPADKKDNGKDDQRHETGRHDEKVPSAPIIEQPALMSATWPVCSEPAHICCLFHNV